MAVASITFRVALIVIVIVAVLIIIHASWSLSQISSTRGDDCACSGVSDGDLNSLRIYNIIMLLVGIGLLVYAIVMWLIPTAEARKVQGARMRDRFIRKDT